MTLIKNLRDILDRPITYYILANVFFSVSTFLVNLALPFILDATFYAEFVYIFQMMMFIITLSQLGIVIGLYKYIKINRKDALNIYYFVETGIFIFLLILGCINDNFVSQLTKIGSLSSTENMLFYLSIISSCMYVFNKGKNVADKAFKYMTRVTLFVFILRIVALVILYFVKTNSLSVAFIILFIIPFVGDFRDYVYNTWLHLRMQSINWDMLKSFLLYSLAVWVIGCLFTISDRIFLISTKGYDLQFTTAIAFASGFLGIISLFNQTFQNYFLSNLSLANPKGINVYIQRVKHIAWIYFTLLFIIAVIFSAGVYIFYSRLGVIAAIVLFVTLIRVGVITYLGMFSMLTKIVDLLRIELILGITRVFVVYCLCNLWHPSNLLVWYITVLFIIPFPEIFLAYISCRKAKRLNNNQ